jgi:short-subunit dehydrogenase
MIVSDIVRKEVKKENIDVLTVTPGPTSSNMTKFKGPLVLDPNTHVTQVLRHLGQYDHTYGDIKHWIYVTGYKYKVFNDWFKKNHKISK